MKNMKEKKVLYFEIGDFFVEAEYGIGSDSETVEFWLCRKDYCEKQFIFGIPKSNLPDGKLENAFAEFMPLFCDREYMNSYLKDFLEGDEEVDDLFNVFDSTDGEVALRKRGELC